MPTYNEAALNAELSRDEGRRATPYKDSRGFLTVAIGHNLDAGPLPGQTYPMSNAQIDALFASDVASTVEKLDTYLSWWRQLDDARQRVLINMTFNLGIGRPGKGTGLLAFGTFLGFVRSGQYGQAADDMLHTLWARQVGNRAVRLAAMMRGASFVQPAAVPATPAVVKASLMDAGSRTINAANIQNQVYAVSGTVAAGTGIVASVSNTLAMVPPWGWAVLALAVIAALYLLTHRIVLARIEDAITGAHTGRDIGLVRPVAQPVEPVAAPVEPTQPETAPAPPDANGGVSDPAAPTATVDPQIASPTPTLNVTIGPTAETSNG